MKNLGLFVGLGLLGFALYLFSKRKPVQATAAGNFTSAGNALTPNRFGFGGPVSTNQVQPVNAPPSYATLGAAGINALATLAGNYVSRTRTTSVPTVGADRAVIPQPTANPNTDTSAPEYRAPSIERYDTEAGLSTGDSIGSPYDSEAGLIVG